MIYKSETVLNWAIEEITVRRMFFLGDSSKGEFEEDE